MKSVRWMASYILVASFGLWLAFVVSMKFMTPAHSQDAPAAGDLPAEFMKDIENTPAQPAPAAGTPSPDANTTAPAQSPPQTPPSQGAPSQQGFEDANQQPIGDGMTAPQINTTGDDYVYDPTGKRDPFKPFKELRPIADKGNGASVKQGSLEPLQRWDLDRLQVVGILWEVKRPRAMLRDPDGAVYTIVKSSRVGRNEGIVTAIREGEVVIVETLYIDGAPQKEPRVLEFKK